MRKVLTPRQTLVAERLYVEFKWSIVRIAEASGAGRKALQNALVRRGVPIVRHRPTESDSEPPFLTAVLWFAAAALEQDDPEPPYKTVTVGDAPILVFRRRRCQDCGRVTEYAVGCCRPTFDVPVQDPRDVEIAQLRAEETRRAFR